MRLQPVVAQPLRRMAVRDVRLSNGVLIPAGTGIELASYSIARSAAWGWKDGEAYKPVRRLPAPLLRTARAIVCWFRIWSVSASCSVLWRWA